MRVGTYGRGCFEVTRPKGPCLSVESSLGFGFSHQGASYTQPLYIYNSGDGALLISAITRTSGSSDFAIGPITLPATVAPAATLTIPVVFTPSSAADLSATFQIDSNDPHSPYALAVSGAGIAAGAPRLATNPALATGFGATATGTRRSILLQLFNTGMSDLHISSIQVSGPSAFTVSTTSFPMTVVPGGEADVTLTYSPTATGDSQATIQIASDDPRGTSSISVTGSGT